MGVTCSAPTPILCILVKCIFWRISRMWSSRCQEMTKIWSRREGQTRMKGWQLYRANRHGFFLIQQINHWNKGFLKQFIFSPLLPLLASVVSAQQLLALRKPRAWEVWKLLCLSGSCFFNHRLSGVCCATSHSPCMVSNLVPSFRSWSLAASLRQVSTILYR